MKTENTKENFFRLSIRWWGLMTAAGVVAGAASLLGFFGSLHWFLDLCSHFRVQYFFGLSVVALLLLISRKRRSAAVFGALAAANLGVILPAFFGRTSAPTSAEQPVRAMLVNVNTRYGNSARVADALRRFSPDIVVLEEVSTKWLSDLGPVLASYEHSSQEPREDNFGIALFSRFPFTQSGVAYIGDAEVPSIVAEIETGQGKCTVLATHPLPPAGREYSRLRNGQLAQLPRYVHRAASPVLLLGDLNVSPWSPYFRRLLRESGLRDSAQGRGVRPTWPTFNPLMLIPIDHCLYSPGIAIVNRQTGPHVGSDHFPVVVDFVIRANGMGEANHAWKNNDFAASVALLPKLVAELKQPRYLHAGDQRLVRNEMLPFDNDPRLSIQRDVVYGKTVPEVQRLDAYLVKSEQPTPVLIEFHGGGWETDTKGQTNN